MAETKQLAVIETGGKQYLVQKGDVITVEIFEGAEEGKKVTFDTVLLSAGEKDTQIGAPSVKGAKVEGKVVALGRGKKIDVMKYKAKSRYHKRYGHRQPFAKVEITNI